MNFIDYETIDPALKDDEYYFRFIDIVKENRAYYGNKCDVLLDKVRDKYGYCALDIANALDVNPTALTRVRKSGFIAGPQLLSSLCYNYFKMSCHEFLFNDSDPVSPLPRRLAAAGKVMEESMLHTRKKILDMVADVRADYEKEHGPYQRNVVLLPGERFQEFADENFSTIYQCLGDKGGWRVNIVLRGLNRFNPENIRGGAHLDTVMYLAYAMGTTIDSLLVQDYSKVTSIGYRYANRVVKFTDSSTVKTMSHLLNLSNDVQNRCIASIFNECKEDGLKAV